VASRARSWPRPPGQQTQRLGNRVGASIDGATLNLSSLDVLAMDSTSVSAKARVSVNGGDTATTSLLRNAVVSTSGSVSVVALDASRWTAQGGNYTVNSAGNGTLGSASAGNEVVASVSARIDGSTVVAQDLRSFAKADGMLSATVLAGSVGPTEHGMIDQWVDSRAQRAWNLLNGGVSLTVDASTLTLTSTMTSGAIAQNEAVGDDTRRRPAILGSRRTPGGTSAGQPTARNVVGWAEASRRCTGSSRPSAARAAAGLALPGSRHDQRLVDHRPVGG
jgi:hypothetical protein